jgi:hypothetical protein
MKTIISFAFFVFVLLGHLDAADPISNLKETEPALVAAKELQRLNNLISITEKNLENQKALKELFLEYQKQQVNYLQNSDDKEATLRMVKSAHRLLESIKANHLLETFDTEFISQLTFFSQFATKRGVPKT